MSDAPPLAVIGNITSNDVHPSGDSDFVIRPSSGGEPDIRIAPDSTVCDDCLRELFDPSDRRYAYPFITCTNCGPRYSIITDTPYDRPNTTMAGFPLCSGCLREYHDPNDRRFHAQPVACPECGPQVRLVSPAGRIMADGNPAVTQTVALLEEGAIIAIKGIGGYHLAVDACNHNAVSRLRERKKRDEKPFAVMAAHLEAARQLAWMSDTEIRLLCSCEAPIVIVRKNPGSELSPLIAPGNGWLGLMLPYSPLHHLLFAPHDTKCTALVMTSGNMSEEPIAYRDDDALTRLSGFADALLVHDRPIHIRQDDSVIRVFQGRPLFYRRSRGYVPRSIQLPFRSVPVLAAGADLKSAVCLSHGTNAFLSQHIGDLQNESTYDSFRHTVTHLSKLLSITPELIACDMHPDFHSTRFAEQSGVPVIKVQHHHAHLASCMAENTLDGEVIGLILDGTGLGEDGTIWGGEFLVGGYGSYRRAAHFRPLPLPGGDAAIREPWRMAISYLYQSLGDGAFTVVHPVTDHLAGHERQLFARMLQRGINSPLTSSCGRLFDAVAALLDVRHIVSYDGQAAIELEALAECDAGTPLPAYEVSTGESGTLDFSPMFPAILLDLEAGISRASIALRFHHTVSTAVTGVVMLIARATGLDRVVLSGGVFQNRLLSEMVYTALTGYGLQVFTHRLAPPNDGGISLGQAAIAAHAKY